MLRYKVENGFPVNIDADISEFYTLQDPEQPSIQHEVIDISITVTNSKGEVLLKKVKTISSDGWNAYRKAYCQGILDIMESTNAGRNQG